MTASEFIVLLRHEVRRIATDRGRSLRMLASVAIPVAAAASFVVYLGRSNSSESAAPELLGASFEQFGVIAGFFFILLEVALVAAASGLVGLDRRRREIGLWMVNGATRRAWITAQVSASVLLGALGAVLGLVIVIALALPVAREADLVALLPIFTVVASIAVFASGLAGWVPAKFVASAPLRDVLLREGHLSQVPRRRIASVRGLIALGSLFAVIAATTLGAHALSVLALAALFVVSALLAIPALLERVAQIAPRVSIAWRVAIRDASRMSARFTPAIAATTISIAVAIAVATLLRTIDAHLLRIGSEGAADRGVLDVLLLACGCAAIATTQIATDLCAIESDSDARVLLSIGAEPSTVRAVAAASAGYVALFSVVVAIPTGVVAAMGVLALAHTRLELTMPWPEILLTASVVPAIAYLVRAWRFKSPNRRFVVGGHG